MWQSRLHTKLKVAANSNISQTIDILMKELFWLSLYLFYPYMYSIETRLKTYWPPCSRSSIQIYTNLQNQNWMVMSKRANTLIHEVIYYCFTTFLEPLLGQKPEQLWRHASNNNWVRHNTTWCYVWDGAFNAKFGKSNLTFCEKWEYNDVKPTSYWLP